MLLPAIVVLVSLSIYPFVYLIRMSFMSFPLTPESKPTFIGFKNWIKTFEDPFFKKSCDVYLYPEMKKAFRMESFLFKTLNPLYKILSRKALATASLFELTCNFS